MCMGVWAWGTNDKSWSNAWDTPRWRAGVGFEALTCVKYGETDLRELPRASLGATKSAYEPYKYI